MTICIGVLCEERKKAVACSDRMLTSYDATLAFEHDEPKIIKLFDNCLTLTAGPATIHQPIFQAVQSEIREAKPNISEIAEKIKEKYQECRRSLMSDIVFSRRGLTIDYFYDNQRTIHESTIMELNEEMDEWDLGLEIIVVGVDRSSDSHVYQILNPGFAIPHNPLGFCCIGTGKRHADVTFAYRRFTPSFSLKRAVYVAFEAKKRAEMAGGVGSVTDIAIISDPEREPEFLESETIEQLEKIYEEMERTRGREIDDAVSELSI